MSAPARAELSECRGNAIAALDTVLREQPQSAQAEALALTRAVVELRDALIEALRGGDAGAKRELDHANALLSLVVSIQYPMQGRQWEKLRQARDALSQLLSGLEESAQPESQR
ncbi:MAG TPA: hypothetical protein VHP37_29885 [Burkholderiales bacterium]|nr:hypothetical protein [Burkholderiales bacterium]